MTNSLVKAEEKGDENGSQTLLCFTVSGKPAKNKDAWGLGLGAAEAGILRITF